MSECSALCKLQQEIQLELYTGFLFLTPSSWGVKRKLRGLGLKCTSCFVSSAREADQARIQMLLTITFLEGGAEACLVYVFRAACTCDGACDAVYMHVIPRTDRTSSPGECSDEVMTLSVIPDRELMGSVQRKEQLAAVQGCQRVSGSFWK